MRGPFTHGCLSHPAGNSFKHRDRLPPVAPTHQGQPNGQQARPVGSGGWMVGGFGYLPSGSCFLSASRRMTEMAACTGTCKSFINYEIKR